MRVISRYSAAALIAFFLGVGSGSLRADSSLYGGNQLPWAGLDGGNGHILEYWYGYLRYTDAGWNTQCDATSGFYYCASGYGYHVPQTEEGYYAIMQADGNFVLYTDSYQTDAVWATNTEGNPFAYLRAQDDGNLVVYRYGVPLWSIW